MNENQEGKTGTEAEVAGTLESIDKDFKTPVVCMFKKIEEKEDGIKDADYRKRPKWKF